MSFNAQELQIIKYGKEQGKSKEEIKEALRRFRTGDIPEKQEEKPIEKEDEGFFDLGFIGQERVEDIKEAGSGIVSQFQQAGENIVETATDDELSLGEKLRGIGSEAYRRGVRAFGEGVLGLGKAFLTEEGEQKVSKVAQEIAQEIAQSNTVQEAIQKYESLSPDTKREVQNALGFAEGLAEIATGGTASRLFKNIIKRVPDIPRAAREPLQQADEVLEQTKRANVPTGRPVTAMDSLRNTLRDIRVDLGIQDLDPQVRNLLESGRVTTDDVNRHFQLAKNAVQNPQKVNPLGAVANKAEEAYQAIDNAITNANRGKQRILDSVEGQRVSGNTINDVIKAGTQDVRRFGVRIDADGTIRQLRGRTSQLDASDERLLKEFYSKLNALGVAPTVREVDDFVDWAHGQLYKQSKSLAKLEAAGDPVVQHLRGVTGNLNNRLKQQVGNGYAEVNARIRELLTLQDLLSRGLGFEGLKGAGLVKSLFSPQTGERTRRIFQGIQDETGIDLFKEATLAKFAMESVGDVRQRTLLQTLDVGIEEASTIDITQPLSVIRFIRERADLDGQELANELIKRFGRD